jgi:vancomycin resistance protein VanJ
VLLFHGAVPNAGGYASLFETFLPWVGVPIVLLAIAALARRSLFAALCVGVAVTVWCVQFLPMLLPATAPGTGQLTVASENVDADNDRPSDAADAIAALHPDVIALQELDSSSTGTVARALAARYPHSYVVGTVGVWSRFPLSNPRALDLGLGWKRALSVDVAAPTGAVRLYAVHAASVRPGQYAQRDEMISALRDTVRADNPARLVIAGDLNSASTDRSFGELASVATEAPTSQLDFGFTWPAAFPLARLDHVLSHGLVTLNSRVLPANGSDHRGVLVTLGSR